MKKHQTSGEYKERNSKVSKSSLTRKLSSKKRRQLIKLGTVETKTTAHGFEQQINRRNKKIHERKPAAVAPVDLRLMENTVECLLFIRNLRSEDYLSRKGNFRFVIMSLEEIKQIDYGTISVLTAINDEFNFKNILLYTKLPKDVKCREFMIESGYLNNLYDMSGERFEKAPESDLIFFEKGQGVLSEDDNRKISLLLKNVVGHLTTHQDHSQSLKTVILEICGNSIEWSGTASKQWLLGVKYESQRVIFTVTDVGKGILDTLYRNHARRFLDSFGSADSVLKGAFRKKYGSTTQEVNRNKGLPAVKANFDSGKICSLKVLTNNVILHFDKDELSSTFESGSARFKGTFYQWR